ncbi:MAG: alpha-ketoacid dehydrogenase subunit beta [Actinomycetota bacterium]|nr:alpha-ketoacid dehydrogenase subunit beta [Candidatus Dormibacteraeota bacterium]MDQ6915962.1 alpha-ketoacid dehydrogenase subunit beta [Actinomycetota bacterium]
MAEMNVVEAIRSALAHELERSEQVILLGLDIGRLGGVFRTTQGLQERFGADRVVATPLAEGAIVGSAIGLAVAGMVPVAELQFLGFSHQAFHQVGPQLARFRYRSRGRFPVQVTLRAPFGGGVGTPEFHPDAVEAQFVQAPGLKVVCPATPGDARGMLLEAIRDPDPVLFLEPQRLYRRGREEVAEGDTTVPLGVARMAREGGDVTLIAWSAAVELAERAAARLAREGIAAGVLDLRSLVPLDVESLVREVSRTGRAVVVHEAPLSAGFGAEIVATLQEECFFSLDAPIARVTAWDTPYPPSSMEGWYLPTVHRVVEAVRRTVQA